MSADGGPVSVRTALNRSLHDAMTEDGRVVVLGEDVHDGVFGVTKGLADRFGTDRVRDTPIAEQAIVGAAVGAALGGLRPVAEVMFMDFLGICLDQLANHAAKLRYMSGGRTPVPMTLRTSVGGGLGVGAQHAQMLEAWLAHVPGLKVVIPSNPADAYGLLRSAIDDEDPCVVIEQVPLYARKGQLGEPVRVPIGSATIARSGTDLTVVTYGRQVHDALAVADVLAEEDVSVEVLDLRSVQPLDTGALFGSVSRTRRAVVLHEAVVTGGFGAEVSALLHEELFADLEAPVRRVGAEPVPVPYAKGLERRMLPGRDRLLATVRQVLA